MTQTDKLHAGMIFKRAWLSRTLLLASIICFSAMLYFAYQTGCAGDLKGATRGDIQLALQFDSYGGIFEILGLGLGAAALVLLTHGLMRIAAPLAFAICGMAIASMIAWQVQDLGAACSGL